MQKRGRDERMWLKWEATMYGKDMKQCGNVKPNAINL